MTRDCFYSAHYGIKRESELNDQKENEQFCVGLTAWPCYVSASMYSQSVTKIA